MADKDLGMLNKAKPVVKSQYQTGNDQPVPADAFVQSSYHDGIYEQFDKTKAPAGWASIQPSFKLNVSADKERTVWAGFVADETNPLASVAASGYDTASAIMPAVSAWPKYDTDGRGNYKAQSGYNDYANANTSTTVTGEGT